MGGYYDYTPLNSREPMSWPAKDCDWCHDPNLVWAYPFGEVRFPRVVDEAGNVRDVDHEAQPWYACARCKTYIDADQVPELATLLELPSKFFDRLMAARLTGSKGYQWGTPLHLTRG